MGHLFLDQYSLLHFSAGVIAYFIKIDIKTWIIINILFETLDNSKIGKEIINNIALFWPGGRKKYPDTLINSMGDILSCILGWYVAFLVDTYGNKMGWYHMP